MSTREDQAINTVPNVSTQNEKKKIFQSNYKLEKQFPEKAFKRKIHEIAYESSRFRGVLNFMGIESGRTGMLKYFKMTMESSKAVRPVPKFRNVSKLQAAMGKFQF